MSEQKMGTFSKEVALHLDINGNTLRRWSLELEKHGYPFERNNNDQRIYYERDIVALSGVKKLLAQRQSMENATKLVATKYKDKENAKKTISVIQNQNENITLSKKQLEEMLNRAAERGANMALEKINHAIEQRDRYFVNSLTESIEQKRLEIAAAEVEKQKELGNRSFLAKWFGIGKKNKES